LSLHPQGQIGKGAGVGVAEIDDVPSRAQRRLRLERRDVTDPHPSWKHIAQLGVDQVWRVAVGATKTGA